MGKQPIAPFCPVTVSNNNLNWSMEGVVGADDGDGRGTVSVTGGEGRGVRIAVNLGGGVCN